MKLKTNKFNPRFLAIAGLCVAFIFSASAAYANLSFSSNTISSDGVLSLDADTNPVNIVRGNWSGWDTGTLTNMVDSQSVNTSSKWSNSIVVNDDSTITGGYLSNINSFTELNGAEGPSQAANIESYIDWNSPGNAQVIIATESTAGLWAGAQVGSGYYDGIIGSVNSVFIQNADADRAVAVEGLFNVGGVPTIGHASVFESAFGTGVNNAAFTNFYGIKLADQSNLDTSGVNQAINYADKFTVNSKGEVSAIVSESIDVGTAIYGEVDLTASGTEAIGFYSYNSVANAVAGQQSFGFYIEPPELFGTGTLQNAYGIWINDFAGVSVSGVKYPIDYAGKFIVDSTGAVTTTTVKTTPVIVSALPTCNAGMTGARAFVTDATATLSAGLGNNVSGTGANKVPVYCDGANWKIGG